MKFVIRYKENSIENKEIDELLEVANDFGDVEVSTWRSRYGAIDLIPYFEIIFLSFVSKTILNGFFKGLLDEQYFKDLGAKTRNNISNEILTYKSYLVNLYKVFISKKLHIKEAISVVEHIDGVVYYAVLNHEKSSENLVSKLPEAIVRAVGEVSLKRIEITEPYTVQLYPNFSTETWDFLFIPTVDGYGNYIDRYFDFRTNETKILNSRSEFFNTFEISDVDTYKHIISAKFHENEN